MTTTTEKKKITIHMSERSPVSIDPEEWPIVAQAKNWNGEHDFQANYIWTIRVREHDDGRRIVYGSHTSGPGGAPIGFRGTSAGFLLDAKADQEATIRAIRRVAGAIGDEKLGAECIADLPAEEI